MENFLAEILSSVEQAVQTASEKQSLNSSLIGLDGINMTSKVDFTEEPPQIYEITGILEFADNGTLHFTNVNVRQTDSGNRLIHAHDIHGNWQTTQALNALPQ